MKRRGVIPRCPNFRLTDRPDGGEEHCFVRAGDDRIRVVRYRRNGNLVAWLLPKGKRPHAGFEIPISTPMTKSVTTLVRAAKRSINKTRGLGRSR